MTTQRTASTKCCPCDGEPPFQPGCGDTDFCIAVNFQGLEPNYSGRFVSFAPTIPPIAEGEAELISLGGVNRLIRFNPFTDLVEVRIHGSFRLLPPSSGTRSFDTAKMVLDIVCLGEGDAQSWRVLSLIYFAESSAAYSDLFVFFGEPDYDNPPYFGIPAVGTPLPNQTEPQPLGTFGGAFGPLCTGGTATVNFTTVCDPPTLSTIAQRCGDPDTTIAVDLEDNTGNLPGVEYASELYELTPDTTEDAPVTVDWVEETCDAPSVTHVGYRCSGSGSPHLYDASLAPLGSQSFRVGSIRYLMSEDTSSDPPVAVDEWFSTVCPVVVTCPPCSGEGASIAIDADLIPLGSLRARVGAVWYQITSTTTTASPVSVDEYSTDPCEGDYYEATRCRNTGIAAGAPEKVRYLPSTPGVGNGAVVLLTIDGDCIRVVRYRPTSVVDTVGLPYTGLHVGGTACSGGPDFITCEGDPEEAIPINSVCAFCGIPGFEYFDDLCAIVCVESMAMKAPPGGEGKGFKGLVPMVKKAVSDRPTYAIPDDFDPQAEARRLRSGGCCGQPSTPGDSPG